MKRGGVCIGSRGSPLARKQAEYARSKLSAAGIESEIKVITTRGDREQEVSFDRMEGTGFFTKEIEKALRKGEISLGVHSLKDLETAPSAGLSHFTLSPREDAADLLIIRPASARRTLPLSLKRKAVVGTSSPRRKMQLLALRPDAILKDLRGNVGTRVEKLRAGEYDAIIIASAGVKRLDLSLDDLTVVRLDPREFIPAPGQGALAIQVRNEDGPLLKKIRAISDPAVQQTTAIEREALRRLEGGCRLPAALYCERSKEGYRIWGAYARRWQEFPKRIFLEQESASGLAEKAAGALLKKKARRKTHVFITTPLAGNSYFRRALRAWGCRVTAHSLVRHRALKAGPLPEARWVFFSSKNAVRYFFQSYPLARSSAMTRRPHNYRFAAIGKGTAEALALHGITAEFTGDSADMRVTATAFSKIAGDEKVLFPMSARSERSIQKHFSGTAIDWVIYETDALPRARIPKADVVLFTSPSNAEAYLGRKPIGAKQRVIAMGVTTARKLAALGVTDYVLPWGYSEVALADAVQSNDHRMTTE